MSEPRLYDPNLYLLAAQLDAVEDLRKATENRFRQATRSEADSDGKVRGLGMSEDDPGVKHTKGLLIDLSDLEHQTVLELQRAMRRHPLGAWQKATVGIGAKQLARLLAAIGDPYWHVVQGRPRTVSELWAYCGLHTVEVGNARGAARRVRGQQANWSTSAKTRAYLIAESCIKQTRSPYREIYDKRRAATEDKTHDRPCPQCNGAGKTDLIPSPWKSGHQHADALRLVSKEILKDLWIQSRDWYRDN